jgi:neutral amino acid transport system ATP-binding protein
MGTLLEVNSLSKRFGGVHAVTDFDLSVDSGTVTGLIGPNGAGKSTAIELISGFLKPDAGTITFDGVQIQGRQPHRISRLGLMRTFQLAREFSKLTVMENMLVAALDLRRAAMWRGILMPGALRRAQERDRMRARDTLEEFGLLHLSDDLAATLSGGQKRLLEFARLVMAKPRMVLLDEPLAGVNPVMGAHIQDSIVALSQRGITVLLVEHNLRMVEALCSSVAVMALGTRIAVGDMSQLRSNAAVVDAYLGSHA